MKFARRFMTVVAASLALVVAACTDASQPTIPQNDSPTMEELQLQAQAERERTALVAEESRITFDSLTAVTTHHGLISDLLNNVKGLLLLCSPLPYDAEVKVIGRRGGTLQVGPHTLVIPAGALNQDVVITAELPTALVSQVKFRPHGLKFNASARPQLTMSYGHCLLSPLAKKIVYTDGSLNILEWLLSKDNKTTKKVTSPLDHFSSYVIAF
jgi:hypothetical protein